MKKNTKETELRSEDLNDILTRIPSKFMRWGSLLILLLIFLILILSWCIKYPDIISAEGYLTTSIAPQKLYAKTTARIDTLLVSDNQIIDKNVILAILENAANNNDVLLLKTLMDTHVMHQDKVQFPFEQLPILFLGDFDASFSEFETSYFQYKINRDLQPYSTKMTASKSSFTQLKNQLSNLRNQQTIHKKEVDFIKKDLDRYKLLLEKGVIAQQDYEGKQIAYYATLKEHENTKLIISQLKESISESNSGSKDLEFLKQREDIKLLKQVIQSFNQLKNAIKAWELKYVLKSHQDGKISFLKQYHSNMTVSENELMFMISPDNIPSYIAKLKTPISSSGKIKIGQDVHIDLNDYPKYEFGVIRGKVQNITNVSDSDGTYIIDVKIPKQLKTSFGKLINFKQDMRVTGSIITEDLRLFERFFYQFRNLYSN